MTDDEIIAKYGKPEENQTYCHLPYKMRLSWQPEITINKFSCHKLIQPNLEAIFQETLEIYGLGNIQTNGLDLFGGCLNYRKMRGGSKLSKHSWGLAVDLDPVHNRMRFGNGKARFAKPDYEVFWDIVEKYGGHSQGRIKDNDWMHFQFVPF